MLTSSTMRPVATTGRLGLTSLLIRFLDLLLTMQDRARTRHELVSMSDHTLKDIGLSRADIYREARKPFWMP